MPDPYYDDVPAHLLWVDDLLTRYGRWAQGRSGGPRTCGSAERAYRAPAVADDDARRTPAPVAMDSLTAVLVQKTLIRVPDRERMVLHVLYVPQRLPVAAQLRMLQVTARDCRARHAAGLRMFGNLYRVAASRQGLPAGPASI